MRPKEEGSQGQIVLHQCITRLSFGCLTQHETFQELSPVFVKFNHANGLNSISSLAYKVSASSTHQATLESRVRE